MWTPPHTVSAQCQYIEINKVFAHRHHRLVYGPWGPLFVFILCGSSISVRCCNCLRMFGFHRLWLYIRMLFRTSFSFRQRPFQWIWCCFRVQFTFKTMFLFSSDIYICNLLDTHTHNIEWFHFCDLRAPSEQRTWSHSIIPLNHFVLGRKPHPSRKSAALMIKPLGRCCVFARFLHARPYRLHFREISVCVSRLTLRLHRRSVNSDVKQLRKWAHTQQMQRLMALSQSSGKKWGESKRKRRNWRGLLNFYTQA